MSDKIFIDRPPRIEPQIPSGEFTIPNPPDTKESPGQLLQQAFLPMVMIMGYILASAFGGRGSNLSMMIPMGLSVLATISLALYSSMKDRKQREEADASYKRRISELRRKMESEHEQQRIYYFYNYPDPEKTLGIAADINRPSEGREEEIRSGTRLWERRPQDHDFMYLRLGISTRLSTVIYKIGENEKTESPLMREATRLAEDSRLLFDVPVTIPLMLQADEREKKKVEAKKKEEDAKEEQAQESKGVTIRQSIGITGKSSDKVHAYVRTMLVDYADIPVAAGYHALRSRHERSAAILALGLRPAPLQGFRQD